MIRHAVFFKFKPEIAAEDRRAFIQGLRELPQRVPGILSPEVGEDFAGTFALISCGVDLRLCRPEGA